METNRIYKDWSNFSDGDTSFSLNFKNNGLLGNGSSSSGSSSTTTSTTNTSNSSSTSSGRFNWDVFGNIVGSISNAAATIFGGQSASAAAQAQAAQYSYQKSAETNKLLWGVVAAVVIIVIVFAFVKIGRR